MASDPTTLRVDGPTPSGGAYSVAYYRGPDGNLAPKSRAVAVEIVEYDAEGRGIMRTYAQIGVDRWVRKHLGITPFP